MVDIERTVEGDGGGDVTGGTAHAVSNSVAARMAIRKSRLNGAGMFEGGVWIFYVEVLIVLALGGFIVWWTMPRKKKSCEGAPKEGPHDGTGKP